MGYRRQLMSKISSIAIFFKSVLEPEDSHAGLLIYRTFHDPVVLMCVALSYAVLTILTIILIIPRLSYAFLLIIRKNRLC